MTLNPLTNDNYKPKHPNFWFVVEVLFPLGSWQVIPNSNFRITQMYYTGIEAFGVKEIGGEPGPTLQDIEAMQDYIKSQFPEGWMIEDGKVVSANFKNYNNGDKQ